MQFVDTTYLERCIATLEKAVRYLLSVNPEDMEYDLYRSACIKEFEIILEQSGKLLRKTLKPYLNSSKAVDSLQFKQVFRTALLHSIISIELCEHFLNYRDKRNSTTHDYGVNFAQDTLLFLPQFIVDVKVLVKAIQIQNNDYKD